MVLADIDRYDQSRNAQIDGRAIILGASMAGLAAAKVVSDVFDEVAVIERDPLPDVPATRDGAPQTSHPHVLLEAGRTTLEDFFPGFSEDVIRSGGLMVDAATEMEYYENGGFFADGPNHLPMLCASRALFEHVVRQHVRELPNVELLDNCRFYDYLYTSENGVTGVRYRDGTGNKKTLSAALVVDATGRTSRTPDWLDENGFEAPDVEEVSINVTYSTIRLDRPSDNRTVLFVPPSPPRKRGVAAIPIEDGQWEFILQGIHGDDAPTDCPAFIEFANSIPVDEAGQLPRERDWVSDEIHHYPFPSSIRRRYDELEEFPDGLVVTGDAIASFNPVYGQGMSVGSLDALLLHHLLAETGLDEFALTYFSRTAAVIQQAWQIAVVADFAFPMTTGPKPLGTDLLNWYINRLIRSAHADGELMDAFYRVFRLEKSATSLFRPGVVRRVLQP
ncbi:NAD(P)/FAD-dependent oxidoreductase [Halopiger aswanensis]|uniref:2-polyprenyl-6-methoxyphenol hydroxylase-like FAD-dependent oxidoreductase n=1 Tax=Halopiger aswanensis TaxID=148449 RepID=A0A419VUU4_9EURY|nr:FAD-dependent monooxygenase [Halopiger aswanensis]RKD85914.1 2-polyprenyl-6-methoxyphenol hydroxylase-like FAD-dependent oxidoreductase [Halopiger aswanensis]